jgi:hypothetical protein
LTEKQRTANTGLAKVGVQCSADQPRLMVNTKFDSPYQSAAADIENRHLRQAQKLYLQALVTTHLIINNTNN